MKTNSKTLTLSGTRADGKILCYATEGLPAVLTVNASCFAGPVPTELTVTVLGYFVEPKPVKVVDPAKLADQIAKTEARLAALKATATV